MSIPEGFRLPSGWTTARLPDLIAGDGILSDGDWVERKDQDPQGTVRLTQLADIGDGFWRDRSNRFMTGAKAGELNCTFLRKGDVLVARMPDPLGRSCLFPGAQRPCVTAVDVCIIRPGQSSVDHAWLMNTINSPYFRATVASLQSGSTRKRISKKNLCTISLPAPPKPEQYRIVEAIETQFTRLDAAVETLKRVQANLNRYRASVLKAAVEGRLVPTEAELARQEGRAYEPASAPLERILEERRRRWEEAELAKMKAKGKEPKNDKWKSKYKEPVGPDESGLPELPEGWCWATVQMLTSGDRTCAYGVLQPGANVDGGVPFVRVGDIDDGRIKAQGLKRIDPAIAAKYKRTVLRGGEVLLTLVGAIGRTAVVPAALAGANTARAVGVIPVSNGASASWVEIFLRNPAKVAEMTGKAHEVARKTLNLEDVRSALIALPPRTEQDRVVECVQDLLSIVTAVVEEVDADVLRCKRLRQSILKWAFEGKLVDQDPEDEPASVLLERSRRNETGPRTKHQQTTLPIESTSQEQA